MKLFQVQSLFTRRTLIKLYEYTFISNLNLTTPKERMTTNADGYDEIFVIVIILNSDKNEVVLNL